ncbi:MAG: phage portal protein [Tepidisphaeraceae bacterium]
MGVQGLAAAAAVRAGATAARTGTQITWRRSALRLGASVVGLALIDQTANASFSSIESQERQMYEQAIRPLVTKLENELMRKLLAENERSTRIKMNMDSRMRAETSSRYAAHAAGINAGLLSINEARAFDDLPPVPGGDQLLLPLNLGSVNAKPDA